MNLLPWLTQLLGDREKLKVVKIGANDGLVDDPTAVLISRHPAWELLCVEPQPSAFERLQGHLGDRPLTTLANVAIADHEGVCEMWVADTRAAREWFGVSAIYLDLLSGFDRETLIRSNPKVEPYLVQIEVNCVPLIKVLEDTGFVDADLVQIDTEGYDFEVLKAWPFERHKPDVFFYESAHLPEPIYKAALELLDGHRYNFVEFGQNIIAMKKGH